MEPEKLTSATGPYGYKTPGSHSHKGPQNSGSFGNSDFTVNPALFIVRNPFVPVRFKNEAIWPARRAGRCRCARQHARIIAVPRDSASRREKSSFAVSASVPRWTPPDAHATRCSCRTLFQIHRFPSLRTASRPWAARRFSTGRSTTGST